MNFNKIIQSFLNNNQIVQQFNLSDKLKIVIELKENLKKILRKNEFYQFLINIETDQLIIAESINCTANTRYIINNVINNEMITKYSNILKALYMLFISRIIDNNTYYMDFEDIIPCFKIRFIYNNE